MELIVRIYVKHSVTLNILTTIMIIFMLLKMNIYKRVI